MIQNIESSKWFSNFQFRMNENGDVEVLSNKSDDDSSNEDNALKIDDSFDGSPTNTINLATQSNSGDTVSQYF